MPSRVGSSYSPQALVWRACRCAVGVALVGEVTGAQRVPVGRHRDLSREPLSSVLRIVLQKEKRAGPDRSSQHSDYGTRLISPLVAD
jgi:hypothetical protein